jgi:hypothetical protein
MNIVLDSWRDGQTMGELAALALHDGDRLGLADHADIDARGVEQRPERPELGIHALADDDVICSCRDHGLPETGAVDT